MKAVIKIKTNRIYFEQFETLGDRADVAAVKSAWEAAIYEVIEAAGFTAEVEIGVGYDPAIQKFVSVTVSDLDNVSRDYANEIECELIQTVELCERCGAIFADQADEAGYDAAAAKSAEIIKAGKEFADESRKSKSEGNHTYNEMSSMEKLGLGIFLSLRDIELSAELNDKDFDEQFPNQSRVEFVQTRVGRIESLLQMLDFYPSRNT